MDDLTGHGVNDEGTLDSEEIGVRRARALAEEAAQAERRRARRRRLVGVAIIVVGLAVGAAAVANATRSGDDQDTRVLGTSINAVPRQKGGKTSATTTDASSSGTATTASTAPAKPKWPNEVSGRPKAFGKLNDPPPGASGGLKPGYYLWQDFDGWHLWLVGPSNDDVQVYGDDDVSKADTVVSGSVQRDANHFTFSPGSAAVSGVDFNPGYFAKTIVVTVDGDTPLFVGAGMKQVDHSYGVQYSAANP